MRKISIIITILSLVAAKAAAKEGDEHLLGVKYSYNLSGVMFDPPTMGGDFTPAPLNISVLYTYYHSLWGKHPYFGLQTGLKYGQEAVTLKSGETVTGIERYNIIELPLISQFRINFGQFRFLLNIGGFGAYRLSIDREGGFQDYDIRYDYGIIGGGGIGFIARPFEFHLECNYKYGFSDLYANDRYGDERWVYSNTNHIMISIGIYVHLDKPVDKRRRK